MKSLQFISPAGTPYIFDISISDAISVSGKGYTFHIIGQHAHTGAVQKGEYILHDIEHKSLLYFFEKLSLDYKLRLPQNRRPALEPATDIDYRDVLLENLSDGMLYGYGDPAILRTDDSGKTCYYLVLTSNDAPNSFPIIKSTNLQDWIFVGYVFPEGEKPVWAADGEFVSDYWAPELHKVDNEYRVYFVARDKQTRELCIGMARSANPEGPFISSQEPILKGNVIDPHIFIHNHNAAYLFWKEDNNDVWPSALIRLFYDNPGIIAQIFSEAEDQATASFAVALWPWLCKLEPMERFLFIQVFIESVIARYTEIYRSLSSMVDSQPEDISFAIRSVLKYIKTPMYAQLLADDGISLIGERIKIIENDLQWEAHLVEGMWLTRQNDKYYLFYAGNDFSTDQYGIGVAIADSPLGPYHKMTQPFLQSTSKWLAPGHPSVTTAPDGKPVMFLHAYFPGEAGYKQFRALLAVPLRFEPDRVLIG